LLRDGVLTGAFHFARPRRYRTPMVSTTGVPVAERWNTRRAAILRILRGAEKDLLMAAPS
jgi:hypothetical protein